MSYGGIWSGHDTTGLSINRVNMHFGTYANATTTNDARSAFVSCPTHTPGGSQSSRCNHRATTGAAQRRQSNCAALAVMTATMG